MSHLALPVALRYLGIPVEHPCHKCGASVEDGTPFCPQCSAPQIRVGVIESGERSAAVAEGVVLSPDAAALRAVIEWVPALWSALVAISAAIFIMLLRTPAALAMLAAGFFCVLLYRRRSHAGQITAGMGARLGALTGALGFTIPAAIVALAAAFGLRAQIQETFLKALQEYAAHSSDPHVTQLLELSNSPEGFTLLMTLFLVMTLVAFLIFSSLGGVLGALLLRRKDRM
jgi:hypothetical protein